MYQVIPRKYRPQLFKEVVGHEAVVTTLKNALRLGRIAQAYLFCGSHGTGKTTLARLFAKALNCHQLTAEGEPCNACPSCVELMEGRSLDIIEIDGASNRGIDDIRSLNETIGYATTSGKYKIFIIDEVHMLTKEAFNALLKTLEEPPANVKFFFATTEPHKVLPTILSRCQRFELGRLPHALIQSKLQAISASLNLAIEEAALSELARLSDGSLRDAESLLDQLACYSQGPLTLDGVRTMFGLLPAQFFGALDEAIAASDAQKARALAEEIFMTGKNPGAVVDGLLEHFRTQLISKSSRYTKAECLSLLDILLDAEQQMVKTPFKRIHLEMLLIHLARSKNRLSLEQLVERLLALEGRAPTPAPAPLPAPVQKKIEPLPVPTPAPVPAQKKIEPPAPPPEPKKIEVNNPLPKSHPSRYDTLLRFAAVELEGTIKN